MKRGTWIVGIASVVAVSLAAGFVVSRAGDGANGGDDLTLSLYRAAHKTIGMPIKCPDCERPMSDTWHKGRYIPACVHCRPDLSAPVLPVVTPQ